MATMIVQTHASWSPFRSSPTPTSSALKSCKALFAYPKDTLKTETLLVATLATKVMPPGRLLWSSLRSKFNIPRPTAARNSSPCAVTVLSLATIHSTNTCPWSPFCSSPTPSPTSPGRRAARSSSGGGPSASTTAPPTSTTAPSPSRSTPASTGAWPWSRPTLYCG
jgi:hypothetical protein